MGIFTDFFNIFFPSLCPACSGPKETIEASLCIRCLSQLSLTRYTRTQDNSIGSLFWGVSPIQDATALLYFTQGGHIQQIIHSIKYKGRKDLAFILGRMLGIQLREDCQYQSADYLIPVPIHPAKRKIRTYNQSEEIAKGIALETGILLRTDCLVKSKTTSTQTQKKRSQRWENVLQTFCLQNDSDLESKKIILVDDVITTGATLSACSQKFEGINNLTVLAVAIALTL